MKDVGNSLREVIQFAKGHTVGNYQSQNMKLGISQSKVDALHHGVTQKISQLINQSIS